MAGKSWIKLWLSLLSNERFCALTDAERWGYVHTVMVAESVDYTFANEGQLRLKVGSSYRYVKRLRAVGLLDGLKVYQGAERQAPIDRTAAERQARYNEKHPRVNNAVVNGVANGVASVNPELQRDRDIPGSNEPSSSPNAGHGGVVKRVFEAWATRHSTAKFTDDRRRKVLARLREGYTEADLLDAVHGITLSPHHMGENATGTVYDDLELICRSGRHVEKFREYARNGGDEKRLADLEAEVERQEAWA